MKMSAFDYIHDCLYTSDAQVFASASRKSF